MSGLASLALPSFGLVPLLIGGAVLLAVGAGGGAFVTHKLDGTALAQSQAQTARAKSDMTAYEALVAGDTAKANALALQQSDTLQTRLNALQAQLAQTQKENDAKSAKLSSLLASAKPGDIRPLGPVSLAYFTQLRSSAAPRTPTNH